ncbi:GNAT family acetyltransferase (plasmid) [Rhizobium leguminosarum bv. trifolii CB782]|uniref:N-acetyltransferase n=1 Tax=Rhizobium hidalgonense TaxID=1538159 RepID=A0A2A6KJD4_9HYPH|nr:GNAT family N-acetyltransferase [Rhizobium hidalgonense]AHG48321.1 GNAT family acetyltransferase [Rhizobium leguminosarum bv. trifolii CB782]MDR9772073.1 GNAT family N-acetyltransferase [Rhizobium hidalgonense]MDR9810131.1 GNAT family N-acetyltransferase [Rhizobium hidalgonense]MDR9817841.1 GNAT family N-acetyltransferase [Rhizobium hidalgonense]PDT24997.1 N-acetyltransferase [Rhizobium hidalgonense]
MQTSQIDFAAFGTEHLGAAVQLSRQAGWPHRVQDWEMALALSKGVVAIENDRVVGTVLVTPYKQDCATINMVIVDETMRGRGLGRKLMHAAIELAGERPLRLVATAEGLPLYEKLGFRQTGRILQHQGIAAEVATPMTTSAATMTDFSAVTELDRQAFGADRADLIAYLAKVGELAVVRRDGGVAGFAVLRTFGRGEVIGPVVAGNLEDAKALVAHFIALRPGAFLRIDTTAASGLSDWVAEQGFAHVGGGIAMMKPSFPGAEPVATIFALANQALG